MELRDSVDVFPLPFRYISYKSVSTGIGLVEHIRPLP